VLRARLAVLAGAMLWGTTGTAQAFAPAGSTPPTVGAARIALGAVALLLPLAVERQGSRWRALLEPGTRGAAAVAMASMAAYQLLFFAGVDRAGVAVGTVVGIGSAPVWTGIIAAVVRRERPVAVWYASTALAVVGAALLVGGGGGRSVAPVGVVLALGAGGSYAAFTVASKVLLDAGLRPAEAMAVVFAGGAVLLLPVLATGDVAWMAEPRGAIVVAWLGLVTVGVGYVLFGRGLRRLPAATAATLTLAEPLTAAVLGVVVLAERTGAVGTIGAALVAAGLVLLVAAPRVASRRSPFRGARR
jgi:drug/metabolite transporter, DME family